MKKIYIILPLIVLGLFLAPRFSFAYDDTVSTSLSVYPGYYSENTASFEFSNTDPSLPFESVSASGTYSFSPSYSYPYYYGLYESIEICSNSSCSGAGDPILSSGIEAEGCSGSSPADAEFSVNSSPFYLPSIFYVIVGANTYCNGSNFTVNQLTFSNTTTPSNGVYDGLPPPPPPLPTVNFLYPGSGSTTAPFNNFILGFTNLTSTDEYQVSVQYGIPQTSYENTAPPQELTGAQLEDYGLAVPRTALGLQTDATSTWEFASANLYDVTDFEIPDALDNFLVATTTTIFNQITASAIGNPNGTSTYLNVLPFGNASSGISAIITGTSTLPIGYSTQSTATGVVNAPSCPAPSGITDIGGGIYWALCNAGYILFQPQTSIQGYLTSGYDTFQNAFPFSVVFGLHALFSNAVASDTESGAATIALTMPSFVPTIGGDTMTLVNSSTLKNAIGSTNFTTLFALEDALLWIFFAWLVYEIITK